jgi:hypothetical protein
MGIIVAHSQARGASPFRPGTAGLSEGRREGLGAYVRVTRVSGRGSGPVVNRATG